MHSKLSSIVPLFVGLTAGIGTSQDAPRTAIPAATVPLTAPPVEALPTEATPPKALPYVFFGDYDGDELADAFIVQPDGSGRLVHNEGDGLFIDVTDRTGLTGAKGMHMATWGDANGDGKLDLYLPAWNGASRLFVQIDDSTFVEKTEAAGLPLYAEPLDAEWLDFDNDGHLDLKLTTLYDDLVYKNDGRGQFLRVELGLAPRENAASRSQPPTRVAAARAGGGSNPIGPGGPITGPAAGPPGSEPICTIGIRDQANPANCVAASTVPGLGMLFPISNEWYVDAGTGNVGLGTTSPSENLEVMGNVRTNGQLISTVTAGTPPLIVSSGTRVNNLNADRLDGLNASAFAQLPIDSGDILDGSIDTADLADSAVTGAKLATNSVSSGKIVNGSITANDLADDSVGITELQAGAVGGLELQAGAVSNVHVDNFAAIHGSKIDANFGAQTVYSEVLNSGYGTSADPSIRFADTEPTGLSSPFTNELHFSSAGTSMMRIYPDGGISMGQDAGYLFVRAYAHHSVAPPPGAWSSAMVGYNQSPTGGIGVNGWVEADDGGRGISGSNLSTTGIGYGVWGSHNNAGGGAGVAGVSYADNGVGVRGECTQPAGTGVFALGQQFGMYGTTLQPSGTGVFGWGSTSGSFSDGVAGMAEHMLGFGVWGVNNVSGGAGLAATGDIVATGTKFFVQPHPEYADKVVRFVCLEGNEAGTYFRGSSATFGKVVEIDVPDVFRMVSDPNDITVQVTPRGPAMVWVESVDLERIVVRSSADVDFDYFVNGVRRGYQDVDIIAENRLYVPEEVGLPYGAHLPDEVRRMLVNNGTLNADFTPNEATAALLGWDLDKAGTAAAKRAEIEAGSEHQRLDESRVLQEAKASVPRASSGR